MRADLKKGHGVAIIPSSLRTHRYVLRIVGVTYRDRPLREPLSLFYDKRRPLPPYATLPFARCSPGTSARPSRWRKPPVQRGSRMRQS